MRRDGIKAKKFKATMNSKHNIPVAENLLERNFKVDKPNQIMVSHAPGLPELRVFHTRGNILSKPCHFIEAKTL